MDSKSIFSGRFRPVLGLSSLFFSRSAGHCDSFNLFPITTLMSFGAENVAAAAFSSSLASVKREAVRVVF